VFGIHGAHLETVFQACRSHDIPIVDTRHEVAAGHAAEGYARSLRQLGVAMGTAGPGFTNLLTSIANAYLDHSPVLYLSGSAALSQPAVGSAIKAAFESGKPACINVIVDVDPPPPELELLAKR
jgi:thiamine pyrophosphate-dependent acetolactate synthase large subunit-like protein